MISDTHLGLKTDGVDRREEIIGLLIDSIDKARELRDQDFKVRVIFGGDLFNDHDPSEDLIAAFIGVLNHARKYDIIVEVLIGNHDAIAVPQRLSCLSFIKQLKDSHPTITLRESIKTLALEDKKLFITFLPHISRATLTAIKSEHTSPQKYIDAECEKIMAKIGERGAHIAFGHLNVIGAHPGSESNMLNKSNVYLPMCMTNPQPGRTIPLIVNGHIHEPADIGNIHLCGSPLYCSMGETSAKTMTVVFNEAAHNYAPRTVRYATKARPFIQTEVIMVNKTDDFFTVPEVKNLIGRAQDFIVQKLHPVLKFDVTISAENNNYNWQEIVKNVDRQLKHLGQILPINPKVVQHRVVRNLKQKSNLAPDDAVKTFLKSNLKSDVDRAKRIYKKSRAYLGAE